MEKLPIKLDIGAAKANISTDTWFSLKRELLIFLVGHMSEHPFKNLVPEGLFKILYLQPV